MIRQAASLAGRSLVMIALGDCPHRRPDLRPGRRPRSDPALARRCPGAVGKEPATSPP